MKGWNVLGAVLMGLAVTTAAQGAVAQRPARDGAERAAQRPAKEATAARKGLELIRPELVVRNAQELGLTAEQQESIRAEVQQTRRRLAGTQQTLQAEMAALNALLEEQPVNQEKVLAQLDKVLDAEREIKKANMTLALSIRSRLTPEQIEAASKLTADGAKREGVERPAGGAERPGQKAAPEETAALRVKLQEVQALARRKQAQGVDISRARELVESVKGLVAEGKMKEANEALDGARKLLESGLP